MSSTNRGTIRNVNDFYPTPRETIESLLKNHKIEYPVLEPCAGEGAIVRLLNQTKIIYSNDIDTKRFQNKYNLDVSKSWASDWDNVQTVITNPPFNIALPIIQNVFEHINIGAEVIMLLRLNFLGSQERKCFWDKYPPIKLFILTHRPKFYNHKTDSIEYAWFVWQKGYCENSTILKII